MLENHMILVGREGVEPPNGVPELIYSQRPLATWIPARKYCRFSIADFRLMTLAAYAILTPKISNPKSKIYNIGSRRRESNP